MKKKEIFLVFQSLSMIISILLVVIMLYNYITMDSLDKILSEIPLPLVFLSIMIMFIYFSFYSFLLFLVYIKGNKFIILKSISANILCLSLLYIFAANPDIIFITFCFVIQIAIQLIGLLILKKRRN